jgi:hypothetical protein
MVPRLFEMTEALDYPGLGGHPALCAKRVSNVKTPNTIPGISQQRSNGSLHTPEKSGLTQCLSRLASDCARRRFWVRAAEAAISPRRSARRCGACAVRTSS